MRFPTRIIRCVRFQSDESAPSAVTFNWVLLHDLGLLALGRLYWSGHRALALCLHPVPPSPCLRVAFGAMLPDPLQLVSKLYPREPLKSLRRFHAWIHTKRKLNWQLGVIAQLVVCSARCRVARDIG